MYKLKKKTKSQQSFQAKIHQSTTGELQETNSYPKSRSSDANFIKFDSSPKNRFLDHFFNDWSYSFK